MKQLSSLVRHKGRVLPAAALFGLVLAAGLAGCRGPATERPQAPELGQLSFVESVPVETELDLAELPEAASVWRESLAAARDSIDLLAFYISACEDSSGALRPVLDELARAAARGVVLRGIVDQGFYGTYPRVVDWLGALPGAELRRLDAAAVWGGVQHAKGFAVDDELIFIGSQNWDWRALTHIRELGLLIRDRELTRRFRSIFALDWRLAEGAGHEAPLEGRGGGGPAGTLPPVALRTDTGDTVLVNLAASPPAALPAGIPWDQELLLALLDGADRRIRLQLLSYHVQDRDGSPYPVLDDALRRAARRGVRVEVILANWAKRPHSLPAIQELAREPGIEICFSNIPAWSGGFIPYARVEHPKYATVDGRELWLGTANWGRSYFHTSRNISVFVTGAGGCAVADRFFDRSWTSPYVEVVDPDASYTAPRRH